MRSLAIINHKCGVGKTATTANLGHALALQGHRVALVDLDPQAHLTASLGIFRSPRHGIDRVLLDGAPLLAHAVDTRELLILVPAGESLAEVETLQGGTERGLRLQRALQSFADDVDFLIFDCPSSAGLLAANAVLAVDEVLIPVNPDYLALTGVVKQLVTLQRFQPLRTAPLHYRLFLSRTLPRRRLTHAVQDRLLRHFPRQLLATPVSESAAVAASAAAGRTLFEYRGHSRSAAEFRALCDDFLQDRMLVDEQAHSRDVA